MDSGTRRGDVMRFSTARTTPSVVWIPTAVEPNCRMVKRISNIEIVHKPCTNKITLGEFIGRAFTLIASIAYSTCSYKRKHTQIV
eukprot:1194756-Prorocentrum_minimum.AAC.7